MQKALMAEDTAEITDLDLASLEKNEKSGGIGVLLRCLRVMENVTFLSEQNQVCVNSEHINMWRTVYLFFPSFVPPFFY